MLARSSIPSVQRRCSAAPARPQVAVHRRPLRCHASQQEQEQAQAPSTTTPAPTTPPAESSAPAPLLAKGQGTAIVTGAISILCGVAYLGLVAMMNSRGGELLPPPPEAFIP